MVVRLCIVSYLHAASLLEPLFSAFFPLVSFSLSPEAQLLKRRALRSKFGFKEMEK